MHVRVCACMHVCVWVGVSWLYVLHCKQCAVLCQVLYFSIVQEGIKLFLAHCHGNRTKHAFDHCCNDVWVNGVLVCACERGSNLYCVFSCECVPCGPSCAHCMFVCVSASARLTEPGM